MSEIIWPVYGDSEGDVIGKFEKGQIYSENYGLVGGYSGEFVYAGKGMVVALVKKGKIYAVNNSTIEGHYDSIPCGECANGEIYADNGKSIVGRYSGNDDNAAAAAAAILLFGLTDGVSPDVFDKKEYKKYDDRDLEKDRRTVKERASSSDDDSGSGIGCTMLLIYFVIGVFILACAIVAVMVSVPTFLGVWLLSLLIKFIIRCCKENPEPETEEEKRKFFSIVLWISMILSVGITITGFCTTSRTEEILAGILSCGVEIGVFGWAISSVSKGKWKKLFKSSAKKSAPSSKTAKKVAGDISSKSGSVSATKTATTGTTTGTKTSVTGSTTGTKTSTSAGHSRVRTTINKKEENPKKGIGEDTKSYVSGGTDSSKKVTGKDSVSTTTVSRVHKNIKFKETSGSESTITKTKITDNPYFKTPGDL